MDLFSVCKSCPLRNHVYVWVGSLSTRYVFSKDFSGSASQQTRTLTTICSQSTTSLLFRTRFMIPAEKMEGGRVGNMVARMVARMAAKMEGKTEGKVKCADTFTKDATKLKLRISATTTTCPGSRILMTRSFHPPRRLFPSQGKMDRLVFRVLR